MTALILMTKLGMLLQALGSMKAEYPHELFVARRAWWREQVKKRTGPVCPRSLPKGDRVSLDLFQEEKR